MQKIELLFFKKRSKIFWCFATLILLGVLYMNFIWAGIKDSYKCYSPNKEFYIVRAFNISSYMMPNILGEFGTLLVYTADGELLHNVVMKNFSRELGPYWGTSVNSVFYLGDDSVGLLKLPVSSGVGDGACEKVEQTFFEKYMEWSSAKF